jgi:twitching motility protein PilT
MYKLESFLEAAEKYDASDIHLGAGEHPRVRIKGRLRTIGGENVILDEETVRHIVESTQHESQKERCKKLFQQNGSVDYSYETSLDDKPLRYRMQVYFSMGKLSIAMRKVRYDIATFEQLNLPPIYKSVIENIEQKGIIIVGGETGSGKSTTLAAMIRHLSRYSDKHIITIEDPIEYVFQDTKSLIHQRELGQDFPNYAEALRAVLREDPDVIMVGEMRDAETVHATIKAAETGHLVLTSLHTATAPWTFSRILNFFKESEHDAIRLNLSYNLLAIMNQMLLPSEKTEVDRIPATEVFDNTPGVRQYLKEKEKEPQLADVIRAGEDEMHNFNMSLARLVSEGHISISEAKAHSRNSQDLEMLIKITGSR